MNQIQRDKRAIKTVLEQIGQATFLEIKLRAGEGLYPAMRQMIDDGEVMAQTVNDRLVYSLPLVEPK